MTLLAVIGVLSAIPLILIAFNAVLHDHEVRRFVAACSLFVLIVAEVMFLKWRIVAGCILLSLGGLLLLADFIAARHAKAARDALNFGYPNFPTDIRSSLGTTHWHDSKQDLDRRRRRHLRSLRSRRE